MQSSVRVSQTKQTQREAEIRGGRLSDKNRLSLSQTLRRSPSTPTSSEEGKVCLIANSMQVLADILRRH